MYIPYENWRFPNWLKSHLSLAPPFINTMYVTTWPISKRGNKWEMLSYKAWTDGRTAVYHNKPVFSRAYKNEWPISWNYEYIIFGQIIFQNFHQFKAFVGLSDCRTIGLSDCRIIATAPDYISDYTISGYPLRRASQTAQKLFEVTLLYLYCRREKTIKGGNFLWRMKLKKLFSGFAISHALWKIVLLFTSRTSSALQFYSESQGRANERNCNWQLQFGKNMSKCKYTYMYFPLFKQVVLSEETVFNEGEGDIDPQALHHGIHLIRSLPRTTGARGTDHPPFSYFLFTNLFSITFLYFFTISPLFPYFNLFVSIFIQSYVNIKLHVSTLYGSL